MSNYWKKKLKELEDSEKASKAEKKDRYWFEKQEALKKEEEKKAASSSDIAPNNVVKGNFTGNREKRTWFDTSAFDDGFQISDIPKVILGSATDIGENLTAGLMGIGEKLVDAGATIAPYVAKGQFYQNGGAYQSLDTQKMFNESIEESKKGMSEFVKKDLYDEEAFAKWIIAGTDEYSVFGEKSDALAQSAGQLGGNLLANAIAPGSGLLLTGATAFGGQAESALNEGASLEEAALSATISAGAEMLTEQIFSGIKFGDITLEERFIQPLVNKITDKVQKRLVEFGLDTVGEGLEEVISEVFTNLGSALYKEEDLKELLIGDEALDGYIEAAIGGSVLGGFSNVAQSVANRNKVELNENEQKVFDKVYDELVAEAEDGGYVSEKKKNEIRNDVLRMMQRGSLSIDTIEEVLGGESYQTYKDTIDKEDATLKEFEELYEGEELRQQIAGFLEHSERGNLKTKLGEEVQSLVKGSRLAESYNERYRGRMKFTADLTKYDEKRRATIQRAIDSGILNNKRTTHEFVDWLASIEAEKGIVFDFTNNEKLKNSGFAVDGKIVNGFVTKNGVTLNIESAKALNSVVGHEITHVLEGTELYGELQKVLFSYAESRKATDSKFKNEYLERLHRAQQLYKGVEGYEGLQGSEKIKKEVAADLVGDYLFTDSKFVDHLAVTNKKGFRKLWDEIKYLHKLATAGSKEARELEKVKRVFEKAYQQNFVLKASENITSKRSGEYGVIDNLLGMKRVSNTFANEIIQNEAMAKAFTDVTGVELEGTTEQKRQIIRETVREWQTLAAENDAIAMEAGEQAFAEDAQAQAEADKAKAEQAIRDSGYRSYIRGLFFNGASMAEAQEVARNPEMRAEWESVTGKTLPQNEKSAIKMIRQTKRNPDNIDLPQYSLSVTDKDTIDFLENQEHITTYKAMQVIDGKLYPPMAAKVKDANGKYQLTNPSELGRWQQATEDTKNIKMFKNGVGYYTLNKGDGTSIDAAYNPYEHSSNLVLNDQFESAHRRDNLVVVECVIPVSEMTSGYKAQYAKDSTGVMDWKSGVVAGKIKDNKRQVYLSRYLKPVRILSDAEVASKYKEILDGTGVSVPFNVVQPSLLAALEDAGVDIDYEGSPMYKANQKRAAEKAVRYSISDSDGKQLTNEQQDYSTESEVSFSLSNDTAYMNKAIEANNSSMAVDSNVMEDAKSLRERIAVRMNDIKDRGLVALPDDVEGNTYIANSSYDGTEENTTICPRSLASEAFVDAVSEYLGRPLTVEEQIYISQDLQGRTLTPECLYCYVATDRKAYRAFLGDYVAQRDAVLQKIQENPNADTKTYTKEQIDKMSADAKANSLYVDFLNGRKPTKNMADRFKMWVDTYNSGKPMVDASHLANINKLMGDINSEFGEDLKPQIVDAMKYAQSASWAKKRVNYVAYNGHILKWKQDRINKLNSHYGLRMYSFSDFHPAFVLENMQMITDASVRGLKMLGYTKDTDFVEIFAPSGMNINVSTFGFESGGEVFENNLTGADWETAKRLREQYPNVGVTFVATNDTLVEWALAQDWIDVVIPYHLVRTGAEVAKALEYTNYTSESSDTKTAEWKKGDKKYIAPTEHNNDKATYLAALEKNHLKPRFERFLGNPNYMKLVNECRQPASQSKPVQPIFSEDAAMKALAKLEANGYYQPIGGSVDRMYEIAAEVAENMRSDLAPTRSLSAVGEAPIRRNSFDTFGEDIALAPVADNATAESQPIATESQMNSNDVAPLPSDYEERMSSLTDADAPPARGNKPSKTPEDGKKERLSARQELHKGIMDGIRKVFSGNGFDFDTVLKNAKNLSTFSTVDNTPQRVMEKALGRKEGNILSDLTVNKVAQNETEGIKWLNSYTDRKNGFLKKISDQYHIKPGSKESAAAQMYAEGFYVNDNNDIIEYGDAELAKDFPDSRTQANIKGLARDPRIRQIYDDTLAMINESRTRNAYPEIPRLDNYFLHFRAMQDTFSRLGLPFNPNDIRAKDLPTDLNGVTADLKPGQPFFASAMHRTGKRTSFDLLGGLEQYLTSAKNQIYHIDDIQTLRALRNYIADTYGQAHGLEGLDALSEEEVQDRIDKVYGSHLSTFAKFLNEEANILAGKTALIDRGLEGIIGRRGITFLNTLNGQVGSNQVGYNLSSSLTNFLPVVQTFAKTNKADFVKAFAQTAANKTSSIFGKSDGFAEQSPVMIRRKGADRFHRNFWQKMSEPGYVFMSAVDNVSTELIARTKYNELTRKGMDSQTAHYETDKWVSRLMGDRSLGQMPQLYNSKMLGLITKYQLEVRNQLDSQFYDTIQEAKESTEHIQNGLERNAKMAAKVTSTFVQLAVAQHLFGQAFESVAGYNPAFDIIDVIIKSFGWDDEEDSEDTVLDNIEEGFLALLEDLPYSSVVTDGGRIPISSALPIGELITGEDKYGGEKSRWDTLTEVAPYYLLPGGYGQIKKTVQGLSMFSDDHPIAGSYTDSGNLRFPVEDTLANRLQAGIFGQWASENARDYFDNERSPLNEKQIQEFIDVDLPIRDYWEYREGLRGLTKLEDKAEYIAGLDLPIDKKNLLLNNIADREEDIDLTGYEDYAGFEEFDFAMKNPEKYEIAQKVGGYEAYMQYREDMKDMKLSEKVDYVASLDLTDAQKNALINGETDRKEPIDLSGYNTSDYSSFDEFEYAKESPENYAMAKAVGGYDAYKGYSKSLSDIHADKDKYGQSIRGSKKKKVFEYINNLDADYYTKIILWKSEYTSDDTYNSEIVEYLNSRDDITFEETIAILRKLGFKVTDDGNVTW